MSNDYFQFKQFTVWHQHCAMKVGTDGVLAGALTPIRNCQHILDVGTGSGLIALMLAQRSKEAQVTAIEIDDEAATQAAENFAASPWKDRISLIHGDFNTYVFPTQFDLIVSNPPYFTDSLKNPDQQRTMARHNDTLNYHQLFLKAHELLYPTGVCCIIIPAESENFVNGMAARHHFFPKAVTRIFTKPGKVCRRVFITYWHGDKNALYYPSEKKEQTLYLMDGNSQYTAEYRALTNDFYLKL
ncbi:MAG: methyltransferase [Bacteroidaceae bacterium]|nr:methyltransferase [Bacteroidaceae bacterium]